MIGGYPKKYVYAGAAAFGAVLILYWGFFVDHGPDADVLVIKRAPYTEQVSVSGSVGAAQDVDLGFSQGGRISGVYAKVGDSVSEGTLLAQIENGDLRAALVQKQAALISAEAELADLKAGTRSEQLAVTEAQIESDEVALSQATLTSINAIQDAYTESDDAIRNKIDKFFNDPSTSYPTLKFQTNNSYLESALENNRMNAEIMLSRWKSDIAALSITGDIASAESKALENLALVGILLSNANESLNAVVYDSNYTETIIRGYITDIATARASINAVQKVQTSAVTSRRAAETLLSKDMRNLELERAGSTKSTVEAQIARVAAARADVQNAQALLGKTLILAPFTGIVTRMDAKVGEIFSQTESQISMISDGLFEIEAYVPEVEITGLSVGNLATTSLDAYGPSEFFATRVIAIDPAETVVNGVSTYKVTLQFVSADERIRPGMTASNTITKRTVANAIVVPQGAIFLKDGRQMLQILRDDQAINVPVEVGGGGQIGNVEIMSGIEEGDEVVLNPSI